MSPRAAAKRLVILGSTGSIGRNTLKVVEAFPGRFRVLALAAGGDEKLLERQARAFRPRVVALADPAAVGRLRARLKPLRIEVREGPAGVASLGALEGADLVVSAIAGAAGLLPTWTAVRAGLPVALANKEPLVMAGGLIMAEAARSGSVILPVDSEHHAAAAALRGTPRESVASITLTASGGPFLHTPARELAKVTPAQALRHPRWRMGSKISIDSATLMNKGLEVIEARWLFDLPGERIGVTVHPESVVHAIVHLRDGGLLAYLSRPDMRLPIAAALNHPELLPQADLAPLDPSRLGALTFMPPDEKRFPSIGFARAALRAGGCAPALLNGANEAAVAAFLAGRIGFTAIFRVIAGVMDAVATTPAATLDQVIDADARAREAAETLIAGRARRRPAAKGA